MIESELAANAGREEHTPTPWTIASFGEVKAPDHSVVRIKGFAVSGGNSGMEEAEANAAFIVKAVNSHAELVEALDDARQWLSIIAVELEQPTNEPKHIADTVSRIDAALEKAR